MKKRYKRYLKIYLIPIVFTVVSFTFTTFAWFAYSGLRSVSTEVDVKAWYIEMTKSGQVVTNDIVISLEDIYPGMETIDEVVNIENKGDTDASLRYEITSARVLDTDLNADTSETIGLLEDNLAHAYPFHVNIDLSKKYVGSSGDSSTFEVSVSWPLDSGNDSLDSTWGTNSYNFQNSEQELAQEDQDYVPRSAIQIVISIIAEQYIENNDASDINYNLGDTILYDISSDERCESLSNTCISTTVIDYNNKVGDTTVTLLPTLYSEFLTGTFNEFNTKLSTYTSSWNVTSRALVVDDLMKVISHDIFNTVLNGEDISPIILGNLNYTNRIATEKNRIIDFQGYYTFLNDKFSYLSHNGCYWTNSSFDNDNGFAFGRLNELRGEIYGEDKTTSCKIVPVIIADKNNL